MKRLTLLVILMLLPVFSYSAYILRKPGVEDIYFATGGTGAAETATDNGITTTKIDATHIKLRSAALSVEDAFVLKGVVTNLEFSYLSGLTSNAQAQINAKQASHAKLTALSNSVANRFFYIDNNNVFQTITITGDNVCIKVNSGVPALGSCGGSGSYDGDNVIITGGSIDGVIMGNNEAVVGLNVISLNVDYITMGGVNTTEFSYLDGLDGNIQGLLNLKRGLDNATFTGKGPLTVDNAIIGTQFETDCSYDDNTCGINKSVSGPPATAPSGDEIYDNTAKAQKVGNGVSYDVYSSLYKYYRGSIDQPVAGDNTIYDGPIEFAQVWDNVLLFVADNTGKLSGSASDNVVINFSYCSNIATPTCTNVFTSAPTASGAAITYPSLNNTTPAKGDYIRISVGTSNMTNKKLYIRIRYREQ